MAQITRAQRIQRIKELVDELNKMPPERHEVARLPAVTGEQLLCPVITLGVDEVLLNHNSHRVKAQLRDDPAWEELAKDPHSEPAQRVIDRKVREARADADFVALKESLLIEGQTDPGVMTHEGVLINANTRAVAIREFEEPDRRYLRVAVLPSTVKEDQLSLLELRLQMRKELKVEYSLANELLFIDELSSDRGMSDAAIARELRINPESEKKGAKEISLRLRFLDLIRHMQRVPSEPLPLTFFDRISYEQLREVYRVHSQLVEREPGEAERYLESFLLSIAAHVTAVHLIRKVDVSFMDEYMLPQLEEDELLGPFAGKLAADERTEGKPGGASALRVDDDRDEGPVHMKGLIDMVTRRDKRVAVPGTDFTCRQDDVREAVKAAIVTGISVKRNEQQAANKLEAPSQAVKAATREVGKAVTAMKAVAGDAEFDLKRRKSLEVAFNKLNRAVRGLERELVKDQVIGG